MAFGRDVLPAKFPSPPYEAVTLYGEPLDTRAEVTVHAAWPPESVIVFPPSHPTVETVPDPPMAKVTAPVGVPDALGIPTTVAVIVAGPPDALGEMTLSLILDDPGLRF